MSSRRVLVVGLAAWLAVVTASSVLVWAVISRVGAHLESSEEPLVGASYAAVAAVPDSSPSGRPSSRHHPAAGSSGGPTRTAPGPSSAVPTLSPSASATSGSPSQGAGHGGGSEPSSPSPDGASGGQATSSPSGGATGSPSAQRRTWSGAPGLVTAECRADQVSLVAAQPSNGYQVEVEERGPARLLVQFEGTTDGHEGQTIVSARCAGGTPSFSVSRDDD